MVEHPCPNKIVADMTPAEYAQWKQWALDEVEYQRRCRSETQVAILDAQARIASAAFR